MSSFDEIVLAYDRSIDWSNRLQREIPFILRSMKNRNFERVLDLACGSGRHSIALAEHGSEVIGVDKSDAMIQEARLLAEGLENPPEFIVADMQDIDKTISGEFDLVICLGNSLALLKTLEQLEHVVKSVHDLLTGDGTFVFQVLNFRSILRERFTYFPIKGVYDSGEVKYLFARFFQHHEDNDNSTLVMTSFKRENSNWTTIMALQDVLRLDMGILEEVLRNCQFANVEFYADYHERPLDQDKDRSIVVRAHK